jgi:hypothetical protein
VVLSNATLEAEEVDEPTAENFSLFTDIDNLQTELPNYLMK